LSGSDANEGAVKLASAYHFIRGNKNKKYIVSLNKSFHGSTFLVQNIGCENLMIDPFYTMDKYTGVKRVNRNFKIEDIDWTEVSCFVVETCNYGGKMDPFTEEFWAKLKTLQDDHDVLIVIDDIFFSGGKTGNFAGWKHLPIEPDIFTIGKAITGGFFPLSAFMYNEKVHNVLPDKFFWDHGFTYNYSISGITSALEYLKIVEEQKLFENVPSIIDRAKQTFEKCGCMIINSFGTVFIVVQPRKHPIMYVVPINANDEYFEALEENLTYEGN
jgi:adenosylmethionine-8-amino-7-oxononanoate aminotransferase